MGFLRKGGVPATGGNYRARRKGPKVPMMLVSWEDERVETDYLGLTDEEILRVRAAGARSGWRHRHAWLKSLLLAEVDRLLAASDSGADLD